MTKKIVVLFLLFIMIVLLIFNINFKSSNKSIYWYENYHIVSHALGQIDNYTYTNSLEAFFKSYFGGNRIFDADLKWTNDGFLVLRHDWYQNMGIEYSSGIRPSLNDFKQRKIHNNYTPLTLEEFLYVMVEYNDIYVAFDAKDGNIVSMWKKIVNICKKNNIEEVLDRVIVSFYNYEDYFNIKDIFLFKNYVIRYYDVDKNYNELLEFCLKNNIKVVNISKYILNKSDEYNILLKNGIKIFVAVENDVENFKKYYNMGITGVISDYILEEDLNGL